MPDLGPQWNELDLDGLLAEVSSMAIQPYPEVKPLPSAAEWDAMQSTAIAGALREQAARRCTKMPGFRAKRQ